MYISYYIKNWIFTVSNKNFLKNKIHHTNCVMDFLCLLVCFNPCIYKRCAIRANKLNNVTELVSIPTLTKSAMSSDKHFTTTILVSIPTPYTGCDTHNVNIRCFRRCFNPHTPHGCDADVLPVPIVPHFNPHLPYSRRNHIYIITALVSSPWSQTTEQLFSFIITPHAQKSRTKAGRICGPLINCSNSTF